MSVLIKDMEMPSCCDDCWALDEYGDYPVCRITEEQRGYNFRIREKRMDKCPLVSVPPHGRLIDGDELADGCDAPHWCRWLSEIEDAPTIIEAEEGQVGGDAE